MPVQKSTRLIRNTAILSLRMLFTMLLSFYTSRLVLKALGVEDFGVYNVVCGISSLITVISNSLTEGVTRFVTVEVSGHDDARINQVFALSNTALFIVSLLFLLLSETLGLYLFYQLSIPAASVTAAFWVYQLSVLGMLISFNGIPYVALITAYEKFGFYGTISVVETILRLGITAFLFLLPNSERLIAYGIGLLLVLLVVRIVYVFYVFRLAPFIRYRFSTDKSELTILGSFTGYKLLWEFASACGTQGVNIILNLFFGPLLNAARGIAYQVQNVIYRLLLNFQTPLSPQIIKSYSDGDCCYFQRLVILGTKFSFFVMSLLIIPVAVESKTFLTLWLDSYPACSEVIVALLCFECLLYAAFMPLEFALDAQGEIRGYKVCQSFVYFSVLPLSYVSLVLGADYYVPFLLAIFAQIVIVILRIVWICPKVGISRLQMTSATVRLLITFLGCLVISVLMAKRICHPLLSLSLVFLTNVILVSTIMYWMCLSQDERVIFRNQICKIARKRVKPA